MKGKTIIVTGASSGLGKAIARLFIEKGSNVVMNASNEANLNAAFEEMGAPRNVVLVVGDISKIEVSNRLAKAALDEFGTIDVLVNNAGIFQPKPFLEVEEKELEDFLGVNLKGTFFTSQAVVRQMLKQGGGAIINIGTVLVDRSLYPVSCMELTVRSR